MKIKIKNYDAFQYLEVFKITERRRGKIFRTQRTGKFIKAANAVTLRDLDYTTSPISTSMLRNEDIELEMFEGHH